MTVRGLTAAVLFPHLIDTEVRMVTFLLEQYCLFVAMAWLAREVPSGILRVAQC